MQAQRGDLCFIPTQEEISEHLPETAEMITDEFHVIEDCCSNAIEITAPTEDSILLFSIPNRCMKITHRPMVINPRTDGEWTGIMLIPIEYLNGHNLRN